MKNKEDIIYINMLGEFSITFNHNTISDQNNLLKKPWSLLEYLVTFRNKEISTEELMDLFWRDEASSNPSGALKTLMFRVRKLLIPLNYPPQDLIYQTRKSYGWIKSLTTITDTDCFEALCTRSESPDLIEEEQLAVCLEAVAVYKGNFLPKAEWEVWAIPLHTYYRNLFQKLIHKTLLLLEKKKDYPAIIDLCQKAITFDQYGEDGHYYLIYALYQSGNQTMALKHYKHVNDMFYNEFAITPSAHFRELYKLISDKKHGIIMDLGVVQDSLKEGASEKGAFCCEPAVFRNIYQLGARAIERTGDSIFLCLLSISNLGGELLKPAVQIRAMDELDQSICTSLRRGDIYCRYSINQYLLLLPAATYENGEIVLKRIIQNFKKSYSRKDLSITYSLQSIVPN